MDVDDFNLMKNTLNLVDISSRLIESYSEVLTKIDSKLDVLLEKKES